MQELIIEAKIENMDIVQDFISTNLQGCTAKVQHKISIAVDEIFSNVAHYAYNPKVGDLTIRILMDDAITIEFEDRGIAYDPLSLSTPDVTLSAEEREIGGLGIFMVKNIMDSVEYRREEDRNVLTISCKDIKI